MFIPVFTTANHLNVTILIKSSTQTIVLLLKTYFHIFLSYNLVFQAVYSFQVIPSDLSTNFSFFLSYIMNKKMLKVVTLFLDLHFRFLELTTYESL